MLKSRIDLCNLINDLFPSTSIINGGKNRKKCCCVFHSEKTPSMFINVSTDTYKCFGCGKSGDIFNLVEEHLGLSFHEAAKYLLENYCHDIDTSDLYEKYTHEQEEEYKKQILMLEYNEKAFSYFKEQYNKKDSDSESCREYAENRWSKTFCDSSSFGYAPKNGYNFIEYAKNHNLRFDILEELGIIKQEYGHPGVYYCLYRNRLVIPQRNKFGKIVTFTARSLDKQVTGDKYINGKESAIYKKNNSIFGIDVAFKASKATGKVYLTEGAPDVLRLQSLDITNVIASLGSSWSKEQLQVFLPFSCSLCFIPDSDIPDQGEMFGHGIKSVIRSARLATEMGFQVSIKEIPFDGKPEDPDSYFTSIEKWQELPEKDFILWYAEKHYDKKSTNDDQLKVIYDVCELLVNVKSDVLQATLLHALKERYKRGNIWKRALSDAAKRLQDKKRIEASKESNELDGYNFYRKGQHYYDIDNQGHEREWTNFILKPLFLIADDKQPTRIFELHNEAGIRKTVELKQQDVTKLDRFKEQIEGKGDYRFFEKPDKYEMLKAFMYGKTEEAVRVPQMGWNNLGEKGFYAFCNGIVYEGNWHSVDEYGIIRMEEENIYLPAMSKIHKNNKFIYQNERRFLHQPERDVPMSDFFKCFVEIYGDNGIVAICFYLATLFRDIIVDSTRSFPFLNIYGKKGTGKTEFAVTLMSLFQRNPEISNLESTTNFSLGDKCAEVSNMMVFFDEYKNTLSEKVIDFLKGIYDCAGRVKRSADGEKREETSVDCGVIVTGQEMPTSPDSALFTRGLFCEFVNSERTKQETAKYHELINMRQSHPTNITVELVKYRENFNSSWIKSWQKAQSEIKDQLDNTSIAERFINNWSMMLATAYCLEPHIKELPFTSSQVLNICIKAIKFQQSITNNADEISKFWSLFSKARTIGEIKENSDYKITYVDSIKVSKRRMPAEEVKFEKPTQIIFIREKIVFSKVNMQARREGQQLIPEESMLSYLMSTSNYYGKTKSALKFYNYDNEGNVIKKINDSGVHQISYSQERVMAFDYEGICQTYDIDLATFTEDIKK